ncbi:hypothetical protein CLPU_10c01110 [Gottschalkia purinilytica]|uniref:Uncharacterized protein n=1 Tax=Gottschalkia purinilytica TaxID=1503 RepID=A0A0L0W9E2_GOTPU|nr:hypothetical protein [Gottschalkia purinilytica]KNF08056.1 hypothetical protein CLPU_10c01110 [Gottschalkia purinilytica]
MKRKVVSILLTDIIAVIGLGISTSSADKSNKENIELPKKHYILKETIGDINGDKVNDSVYLVGKKNQRMTFIQLK